MIELFEDVFCQLQSEISATANVGDGSDLLNGDFSSHLHRFDRERFPKQEFFGSWQS